MPTKPTGLAIIAWIMSMIVILILLLIVHFARMA